MKIHCFKEETNWRFNNGDYHYFSSDELALNKIILVELNLRLKTGLDGDRWVIIEV